jgi:hypothetical protein
MTTSLAQRRVSARPTLRASDMAQTLLRATAVAAAVLLVFLLVAGAGGSPSALNQLSVLPIVLGAYLFGWRGALAAAAGAAVLMGPVAILTGLSGGARDPFPWVRPGVILLVGVTVSLLAERLQHSRDQVSRQKRDALIAFARSSEAKDVDTGRHVVRCHGFSAALAKGVGLSAEVVDDIAWSSILHDVGKLHVPDSILLKPGPLDAEEWETMKRHTIWGPEILRDGESFATARRIARWHHENIDGSGYPDGLSGEAIPLEARIVRIADAYDAMTHDRPYQLARSAEEAMYELERYAGRYFDPELTRLFIALLERDAELRRGSFRPLS